MQQRLVPLIARLSVVAAVLLLLQGACAPITPAPVESRNKTTHAAPAKKASPKALSRPGFYRVRKGDTLYSIARRCGTTVEALASLNGFGPSDPIAVGQTLRVP